MKFGRLNAGERRRGIAAFLEGGIQLGIERAAGEFEHGCLAASGVQRLTCVDFLAELEGRGIERVDRVGAAGWLQGVSAVYSAEV